MIYLDANATAPIKPAVRSAIFEAMERHGNPSSVHRYGRIARRYVEDARAAVAAMVGAKATQVVFTSGGTEANNQILESFESRFVSTIEHDSVLAAAGQASKLPVTSDGVVDLFEAEKLLSATSQGSLVSVMLVNNETGIIQPIQEIARIAQKYGHKVHTDAVQAVGRLPIDFINLGVDAMTVSAHKIGGSQGVGALIVKSDLALVPLLQGGGQERNRRPGTENVAGIVGFGVAAQLTADDLRDMPRLNELRDRLQGLLTHAAGDAVVVGLSATRVANTLSIAIPGVSSETQVAAMDLAGIAVSAGSACSSGKVKTSHVLHAMGYSADVSGSALRISLGWHTDQEDIDRCAEAWTNLYRRVRKSDNSKAA